MQKLAALLTGMVIAATTALASQIEIGGSTGITSSYITTNGGNTGGWTERNYDNRLFGQVTNSGSMISPWNGYKYTTGEPSGLAFTDSTNNVSFAVISDGCTGNAPNCYSNNVWEPNSASSVTVPVGVFGVTDAWTMLNNAWGPAGAQDTSVTFNFGTSATGGIVDTLVVQLTNSGNGSTPSGQISTSVQCATNTESPVTCTTYATGPTNPSSSIATSGTGASLLPNITVLTNTLFTAAYNGGNTGGKFANSTGNVVLQDQGFEFGNAFSNLYLVNVQVFDASGASGTSASALSAITVDSATPEPASVFLVLGAVAVAGFRRFRKN
jgi:hypothetical protein